MASEQQIEQITDMVATKFRSFGGGQKYEDCSLCFAMERHQECISDRECECPPKHPGPQRSEGPVERVVNNFEEISEKCPWRSELKCTVLHSAGRYATLGGDKCTGKHCAVMHFIKRF